MDDHANSTTTTNTTDPLTAVAEQICALWTACGGFGPPHEFNVNRWARGAAKISEEHGLTPAQWRDAHQLAVRMGARLSVARQDQTRTGANNVFAEFSFPPYGWCSSLGQKALAPSWSAWSILCPKHAAWRSVEPVARTRRG